MLKEDTIAVPQPPADPSLFKSELKTSKCLKQGST